MKNRNGTINRYNFAQLMKYRFKLDLHNKKQNKNISKRQEIDITVLSASNWLRKLF